MGKKYIQKPGTKPGGMILLELIEQEELEKEKENGQTKQKINRKHNKVK